jgi:hypothetical protein
VSFFRIRKKISKSGKVMTSKKDKENEKRVTHRDLIKVIEE